MEVMEIGRVCERLLVTAIAGVSIILGWHLFKLGVVMPGNLEWKDADRTLKILKVGPGVFFALFGTAILSLVLTFQLKIDSEGEDDKPKEPTATAFHVRYLSGSSDSENNRRQAVLAVNTVLNCINEDKVSRNAVQPADILAVAKAGGALRIMRQSLLEAQFGQLDLQLWEAKGDAWRRDRRSCSVSEGSRLEEMEPWLTWDLETPRP